MGNDPFEIALWVLTSAAIVFLVFCTVVLARALGVLSQARRTLDDIGDELKTTAGKVREAADRHGRVQASTAEKSGPRPASGARAGGDGQRPRPTTTPAPAPAPAPEPATVSGPTSTDIPQQNGEEGESRGA